MGLNLPDQSDELTKLYDKLALYADAFNDLFTYFYNDVGNHHYNASFVEYRIKFELHRRGLQGPRNTQ